MPTSEAEIALHAFTRAAEAVRRISVGLTTTQSRTKPSRKDVVPTLRGPCLAGDPLHRELVFILRTETNFNDLVGRLANLIAAAKETGALEARQHLAGYLEARARHLRARENALTKGLSTGRGAAQSAHIARKAFSGHA
jgi:hypothetical protein